MCAVLESEVQSVEKFVAHLADVGPLFALFKLSFWSPPAPEGNIWLFSS